MLISDWSSDVCSSDLKQSDIIPFDWQRMLMDQYPAGFLLEIIFRALIVFLVVVVSLRVTGRRGVKQLSLFELVFILTLGSAGGDAIFYHDVPLLPIILTFASVVGLYFIVIYLISRNDQVEKWLEGKPRRVIEDGHFVMKHIEKENFSPEEVCMELREKNVSQLGQVKAAILEPSGGLRVFFYPDEEVRPGMSTLSSLGRAHV